MEEVLLYRCVLRFVDELADEIERGGAPPLTHTLDRILDSIPASLSAAEWEDARQQAMREEMLRYRVEVEEPAAAILRERKASRPSAVKKVEVAFSDGITDAAFYRQILEGIEPELEVAEAPGVSSLTFRLSWAPDFCFRNWPFSGFVSSVNHNIAVLYVGPGRPCDCLPWFYLIYDSWASSISVIPQLPSWAANFFSHGGLGSGVAVLRHCAPSDYVLAELLLCREHGYTSNKAELFLWWSSGDCAGRWIHKKVKLPLPSASKEHSSRRTYNFHSDTELAVGRRGLCWVDLLQGILICDNVFAACPRFRFIPLPEECVIDTGHQSRGLPLEYRSVMTTPELPDSEVFIRFVTMDGHGKDRSLADVTLTIWTIQTCKTKGWQSEWVKGPSICLGVLPHSHPLGPIWLQLQPIMPIISTVQASVVYLCFYDTKPFDLVSYRRDQLDHFLFVDDYPLDFPIPEPWVLRVELDVSSMDILRLVHAPSGSADIPDPYIFATDFHKMRGDWTAAEMKRVEELPKYGKCVIEQGWDSEEEETDDKLPLLRFNIWPSPLRGISAPGCFFAPPPGKLSVGLALLADY